MPDSLRDGDQLLAKLSVKVQLWALPDRARRQPALFALHVSHALVSWSLTRRFAQLAQLHASLIELENAECRLPSLPPKHPFAEQSCAFLNERALSVERFFNELLAAPAVSEVQSVLIGAFLETAAVRSLLCVLGDVSARELAVSHELTDVRALFSDASERFQARHATLVSTRARSVCVVADGVVLAGALGAWRGAALAMAKDAALREMQKDLRAESVARGAAMLMVNMVANSRESSSMELRSFGCSTSPSPSRLSFGSQSALESAGELPNALELAALAIEPVLLSGSLLKRGAAGTSFKKRWFVLTKHALFYWPSEEEHASGQRPRGCVLLHTMSAHGGGSGSRGLFNIGSDTPYSFSVEFLNGRVSVGQGEEESPLGGGMRLRSLLSFVTGGNLGTYSLAAETGGEYERWLSMLQKACFEAQAELESAPYMNASETATLVSAFQASAFPVSAISMSAI
mmetsp:Transcript_45137/g.111944  ORF Transcript_45137/g.111944 Transcript_45137/m.111944 type:complete len:460 (-) Transcript_45137:220-1599(-)